MIQNLLLVAIGGAVGSVARYAVATLSQGIGVSTFPLGTFVVNIVGCLLIGFLSASIGQHGGLGETVRLLLVTGFCGGFTTFSTFMSENVHLAESGEVAMMALYLGVSVALGFLAVMFGAWLCRII